MTQAEQLKRVTARIQTHIFAFLKRLQTGERFHMADLTSFVLRREPSIAPDSPGRVLRAMRQAGSARVELVSRAHSLYRKAPRPSPPVGAATGGPASDNGSSPHEPTGRLIAPPNGGRPANPPTGDPSADPPLGTCAGGRRGQVSIGEWLGGDE